MEPLYEVEFIIINSVLKFIDLAGYMHKWKGLQSYRCNVVSIAWSYSQVSFCSTLSLFMYVLLERQRIIIKSVITRRSLQCIQTGTGFGNSRPFIVFIFCLIEYWKWWVSRYPSMQLEKVATYVIQQNNPDHSANTFTFYSIKC